MTQRDSMGFAGLFRTMMRDIRAHKQVLVLLLLLWTPVSTILAAPLMGDIHDLQQIAQTSPDALGERLAAMAPKLLLYSIITTMVMMVFPIFWCRLLLLGRNHVLGQDLPRRYGNVLIRALALFGFQILVLAFMFILAIMLMAIGGMLGLGLPIISGLVTLAALIAFVPLYLAFCLSVTGTSIGHPGFGIVRALNDMKRFLASYLSMSVLIVIICSVLAGILSSPFLDDHDGPTRLSVLIGSLMNGAMLLLIFTASAALYRHYLMPPDLLPRESEDAADV